MRIAIEGPELESVNFKEILDILRSLTADVFRFKNPQLCGFNPWQVYNCDNDRGCKENGFI